jgi:signal transduction histidine kinase
MLLGKIISENQPLAQNKQLHLLFDAPAKPAIILSDRQFMTRIVENLLSNAIKYSPAGKNTWLSLQEEKDQVQIKVKDEGVGIAKEELKNLFTKYSHISAKPTAGEESTGLGLSIVKRLVDELNGKITMESEPGKGSVFTVIFNK